MPMEVWRKVYCVPSRGLSGGLAMFWSGRMGVSISSYSQHHIDAVLDFQSPNPWRFTGFYGSPTVEGKSAAWNILRTLHTHHNLPWLCAGDFNELLSNSEKWGRRLRPEQQMAHFRQVVDDFGFMDLGFTGPSFTWCNKGFSCFRTPGQELCHNGLDASISTLSGPPHACSVFGP